MPRPTPPQPPSSSASAPLLTLRPSRSRLLIVWWCLLHLLLAGSIALVGGPPAVRWVALACVAAHAILRRPPAAPHLVIIGEGALCAVPEWHTGLRRLGPRTSIAPFWVRLDLEPGPWRREVVLLVDQVSAPQWRRLHALLSRAGRRAPSGTAI